MIDVTAAILIENGRVPIARRRPGGPQAGLWEYPGGKVRPGESPAQCHCSARSGKNSVLTSWWASLFGESVYAYADKTIRMSAYRVRARGGKPSAHDHAELAWVAIADLGQYRFCPADIPFTEKLQTMG